MVHNRHKALVIVLQTKTKAGRWRVIISWNLTRILVFIWGGWILMTQRMVLHNYGQTILMTQRAVSPNHRNVCIAKYICMQIFSFSKCMQVRNCIPLTPSPLLLILKSCTTLVTIDFPSRRWQVCLVKMVTTFFCRSLSEWFLEFFFWVISQLKSHCLLEHLMCIHDCMPSGLEMSQSCCKCVCAVSLFLPEILLIEERV